jgi:uncharacterized protein (TIGR00269 family)
MNCRKCGEKAVINMRQHKLALCKEHFPKWIVEHTERIIKNYRMFNPNDRVLVAVWGGKDSLTLWDILWQLGYQSDGVYIGLGIDGGIDYSNESLRLAEKFAGERGLTLHIFNLLEQYGESIPELAQRSVRGKDKPCSVCGLTKRHIMNRLAREGEYDVLVTGHNLDDEAAVLFGNTLSWSMGYLLRQGPVLEARRGLVRKAKPLCRFYEREMATYALVRGIEYINDECPHAIGAKTIYYKELLNKLEADRPGTKLSFYLSFLKAKQKGLFATHTEDTDQLNEIGAAGEQLNVCPSCGQPTSAPSECAFCRMITVKNFDSA